MLNDNCLSNSILPVVNQGGGFCNCLENFKSISERNRKHQVQLNGAEGLDCCTKPKRMKRVEPAWLPEHCQLVLFFPDRTMEESLGKVSSLRKDLKIVTSGGPQ